MLSDEKESDPREITPSANHGLAQRSPALVTRGLRDLSNRDVAMFADLAKALTASLQLDQALRTIMEKIDEFLRPDNWSLLLLDEAKQELYLELAVGTASQALKDVRVKMGQGIAGWAAVHGETVVVSDTSQDTRFFGKVDEKTKTEARSIVAVPVRFRDTCLGVIELINCVGPEGFSQKDLTLLQTLADFAGIAISNAQYVQAIHKLTITDEHTGLYNRAHLGFILDTEIWRSERYSYEFTILFLDLEDLKGLQKSLSYEHFTQLLNELGQALKEQLRLIDFGFYYGDGEFVVLSPQTAKSSGQNLAVRLHRFFESTSWLRSQKHNVRLPARIAVGTFPQDGKTKTDLLRAIDEAAYLLKKSSRNGVVVANVGIV